MGSRLAIGVLLSVAAAVPGRLLSQDGTPSYHSERSLAGTLHVWGPAHMSALSRHWADGFGQVQPGIVLEFTLLGSDTAIPGLYSGRAHLALLGRPNNITDDNGFSRPMGYPPERFELTTGSLDAPGKSCALVVFVHRDNPLTQLTLAQLDAIFGHEHRRGLANIHTWGQLGLSGDWQDRPIRLFGYDIETGTGQFFANTVLLGSRKLNWDHMREFKNMRRSDGTLYRAGEQTIDALRRERYGMALSCLRFASPRVKDLALATEPTGPYVHATKETLISRQYPLTRVTYAFIDRPPGSAIEPRTREFLRYVFSREGQADILREGGYLPLNDATLTAQRERLE